MTKSSSKSCLVQGLLWLFFFPIMLLIVIWKNKNMKTEVKAIITAILVVVVVLFGVFGTNDKNNTSQIQESSSVSSSVSSENTSETSLEESSSLSSNASLSFELKAGEKGEYGQKFTINKDTEFEENYFVYYIPIGTYTVTNIGQYMGQISICSTETTITDDGWEEPAEVFGVCLLDAGESETITIEEGQYIEIHEPAIFKFEQQ